MSIENFDLRVYLEVPDAQKKSFKANGLLAEMASCLGILFNFEFVHLFLSLSTKKFFDIFGCLAQLKVLVKPKLF